MVMAVHSPSSEQSGSVVGSEILSADRVGCEFVRQYYTLLNKDPSQLHRYFIVASFLSLYLVSTLQADHERMGIVISEFAELY